VEVVFGVWGFESLYLSKFIFAKEKSIGEKMAFFLDCVFAVKTYFEVKT